MGNNRFYLITVRPVTICRDNQKGELNNESGQETKSRFKQVFRTNFYSNIQGKLICVIALRDFRICSNKTLLVLVYNLYDFTFA